MVDFTPFYIYMVVMEAVALVIAFLVRRSILRDEALEAKGAGC